MISLDTLRPALLSDQPWTELDRLVRAEQAAGRRVKDIYAELSALVNPARDAFGLTEDADDALMDTLDALVGNCAPRWRYTDPPNTSLPTEEEIATLPRWARVAFAARCARRVLPLYGHFWPKASEDHVRGLSYAASSVEKLIAAHHPTDEVREAYSANIFAAAEAAEAVRYAVLAASRHGAAVAEADKVAAADATLAAGKAWGAASSIADIRPAIRRDFDYLARLAQGQKWTDDTPVPPEVFGPLWPDGPPSGWPADPDDPQRAELPLELLYYIARTETRLTLEGYKALEAVFETAGV